MLHLEFNSDSENEGIARIVTAAYIMKFDPDMEEMDDIKTAVSEAVNNCIVHGYQQPRWKDQHGSSDQNGILRNRRLKNRGYRNSRCQESDGTDVYNKTRRRKDWNGIFFYGSIYGSSRGYFKTRRRNDSDHDKENRRSRQAEWIRRGNCYGLPKKETKQHESRSFLIMLD